MYVQHILVGDVTNSVSIIVEGYICKYGRLCGYIRKYGIRSRNNSIYIFNEIDLSKMVYFGFHDGLHGKPVGPIYKKLFGNSVILSNHGSFFGDNIAYIYLNANFSILGSFDRNSNLKAGQKVTIVTHQCDALGLKKLLYSKPLQPSIMYHYNPPTSTSFGDQPLVADEVGDEYLIIKNSTNAIVKFTF